MPVIILYIIFNLFISENLKTAQGRYTDQPVERISKLNGVLGKDIEKVFSKKIVEKFMTQSKATKVTYKNDLEKFVKTYRNNDLFKCVPGRFHKSFPGFINVISTKKINELEK